SRQLFSSQSDCIERSATKRKSLKRLVCPRVLAQCGYITRRTPVMKQLMAELCDLVRFRPHRDSACLLQTLQIVLLEAYINPRGARCCWGFNMLIQSVSRAGDIL